MQASADLLNEVVVASQQLPQLLRHGRMIAPRRQGKNNFYSLTDAGEKLAVVVKDVMG